MPIIANHTEGRVRKTLPNNPVHFNSVFTHVRDYGLKLVFKQTGLGRTASRPFEANIHRDDLLSYREFNLGSLPMTFNQNEFLTIALFHLLALASPGPDLAVVLRQSITRGLKSGLITSIGVGLGIMVHVNYCLVGLAMIISQSIVVFSILKFIGAGYLIFIGLKAVKVRPAANTNPDQLIHPSNLANKPQSYMSDLRLGFFTNALNPKATLFFLALFTVVISPATTTLVKSFYGIWMMVITTIWFSMLSYFFSARAFRTWYQSVGHWFDRITGAALIALGVKIAFQKA